MGRTRTERVLQDKLVGDLWTVKERNSLVPKTLQGMCMPHGKLSCKIFQGCYKLVRFKSKTHPSLMAHACEPSSWGTEAEGSGMKSSLSYMISSKVM